jgi:hypothetical protein
MLSWRTPNLTSRGGPTCLGTLPNHTRRNQLGLAARRVATGTFDMSNTMSGVGQSAAGIMVVSQNNGFSSLIQQSVNVQSNLNVGK